jgi:hypothetical protein
MTNTSTKISLTVRDGTSQSIALSALYSTDFGMDMWRGKCCAQTANTPGTFFGSGTTPAQKTDFKLESPILSGLSIISQSSLTIVQKGEGKYSASAAFIVQNTTDAEITISEMGYYADVGSYLCLYDRTVLPVPVVIPAGERKLITYEILFNQILNVE